MFTNSYAEEIYESEHVCTADEQLRIILDAKYEKVDLNKAMENQCQNLTETQLKLLLKLLQKFEDSMEHLVPGKQI